MYNKRRITQKILAAVMSVVMLLGLLPVSAFAAGEEDDFQPGAPMQLQNLGNGAAMWAGEKLAGGVVSSIAGYPVNQAMGKIFGTQTDEVLQALEAIKAQIGQLRDDINALSKKVDKVQLQGVLNDYGDFIDRYSSVYNELINAQKINDPAASKLLLTKIFEGKDANYMVGGDSLKNATINLGIRIRSVKATESGACNIFGAIDIYDRYVNVWEHQGYDMRQNFRDKQLALYTLFSSMSQLACQTIIDSNQGSTAEAILAKHEAVSRMKDLRDDAALMNEMVNRTAIIRHPNLRIARDIKQGQDLCAFYPDINVAHVVKDREGDEPLWADFSQNVDRYTSVDYLASMTNDKTVKRTAWSAGWEFYTNQPTPDEYAKLLANYGGTPSLYNIFFDADKGNFNNIGDRHDKLAFLCNHYVVRGRDYDRVTWESNNHIENNGEVKGWWTFSKARFDSKYTGRPRDTWFDYANAFIVNKYMGEVKQGSLQGPAPSSMDDNAAVTISGMGTSYALPYNDPVTLEIDQNDGSYQWSVNKNDGDGFTQLEGETNKTYTLPALTAEMLGWQYSCTTTIDPTPPDAEPEYIYSKPVTLDLTGDDIPGLVLGHDVGTAPELKAALDKVDSDEWNGHTLRLTADITYPNPIALDGMHNLTLDLNGYTLTVQPGSDAQSNVNAMSSKAQIAAICLNEDYLSIEDSSGVSGTLKIVAGPGIDYGIYAANASGFDGYDLVTDDSVNVASTGGTAILAADDSLVAVKGSVRAEGEDAYGVECLNSGSSVIVGKDVAVSGKSACGVYVASFDGGSSTQIVRILSGSLTVSGENSRAALLDANAEFSVGGSITVTGGGEGISVNKGYAEITGDVTAPDYAINARSNNARVVVGGNVSVTRENAVAVSSVGAEISVCGNVTSADSGGVGILAATWISPDDASEHGGLVTVEGNISAVTPLLIESTPVTDESESTEFDDPYNVFAVSARGTSKVKAMPGSFEVKAVSLVTFDKNGGDTEASPTSKEVITGEAAGTLPTSPTRSGYSFNGWNTQADGGGTAFTEATPVTGSITVYAQWKSAIVPVTDITVTGAGGAASVEIGGTLQMQAIVLPHNATNQNVTWSIGGGSGASINASGLLSANAAGTAIVRATAKDGSGVYGEKEIAIINTAPADKTLVSVTSPSAITGVANGTTKTASALGLPSIVALVTDGGSVSADVSWDIASSSYNPANTSAQTFTVNGTVTLPGGVVNPGNSVSLSVIISVTVKATPSSGGGGGGSSSDGTSGGTTTTTPGKTPDQPMTVTAPVMATAGANGSASAVIPDKAITDAIAKAQADARAQGRTANGISVELDVTMPKGSTSLTATLTQSSLNSLVSAGVSQLEVNGAPVSLGLDLNALKEIQKQGSGDISITIAPATGLSKEAKALLGNRPVYSITISYVDKNGKTQTITGLGSGTATLSIPYTPGKNEAVGYLFGVYVDANGKVQRIPGSAYDANSRSLLIPTGHFSVYGVGYTAPSAKFTDIGTHWGRESIDYVVGRGLLSGTSDTTFAPDTAMTRGMLVTALGRLAGVDVKAYITNSFTDVQADSAFHPYIEWAYKKGIVQGIGNGKFAPDRAITREEIAVIFANFAKATGYKLPVIREATAYADASSIGSIYKTAVTAMQQAGIMMGGTGNKFNPKSNATRAEVSSMLHRYIKLTIEPYTAQGWALNDAGQWLYYKGGKALTGTQTIDGVKYFFETTGVLKTGWVKDGDNWHYYSGNKAAMGWLDISDKRYYFTKDGLMVSRKWLQIDGKWYYFYADGALARSTKVDGYEIDGNGVRKSK